VLIRRHAIELAEAELGCLDNHVRNLEAICAEGPYSEWGPGVEQLRSAILRITSDVAAARAAKVQ
jgi:hypothetical protein